MPAWRLGVKAGFFGKSRPLALQVPKHSVGLVHGRLAGHIRRSDVAPAHKNILPAIIVEIGNIHAVSRHRVAEQGHSATRRNLFKRGSRSILINRKRLVSERRENNVGVAVVVQIAKVASHARNQVAVLRQCHTHLESNFFEAIMALVVVQEIEDLVVWDKNVGQAIVVVISYARRHAFARMRANTGLLRNIRKCPIAVVEKELARCFFVELRMAILRLPIEFAVRLLTAIPRHIVHDK